MKKIITVLVLAITLASCNDWLDVRPATELREEEMFETQQGYKDVLTGVYIRMATSSLYGLNTTMVLPENMVQHWEIESDLQKAISEFDFTETGAKSMLETIWVQYYQCIVNLNSILERIDENQDLFNKGNYELIKGEALGLRAFLHFEILRYWGAAPQDIQAGDSAIPYVTMVTKDPNELLTLTYQEVFTNILNDLTEAENLLENDPILSFSADVLNEPNTDNNLALGDEFHYYRQNRFNIFAVKATLARYYIWQGETVKAATYAMEVINAVESEDNELIFNLGGEADASAGDLTFPTEQIFAINNSLATATLTSMFFSNYTAYTQDHAKLEEAYEVTINAADIRFRDDRLWEIKIHPETFNYFKKYWATETTAVEDIPLIRLAEMYFIATENNDANIFREYRVARGLDISIDETLTDQEAIMSRLEKEYRKDLYGEGQMFFFYKRLGYEAFSWPTAIEMDRANYQLPIPETQTLFE
ncbi:RagB/SusD family nutrient uptake outer membrane protein [Carboxylicivirga sp. A043]|uniref:RagB/SusD family nutrient uptake outer membrane protein n=1 Tax=Carboxylicivirga litoralis TaxID=2816963 RepID=UPI0021CB2FB9|nr:RagB/SusD family nutrient uptake outer membrane protein [Carboxylicivirga sp. A043]MCU4158291.1 RagB/SusD family nutrient uptake outer membrane protein [Carboxylicivirga sp. A043]